MISIITSLYNSNKYLNKYNKNIEKFSLHLKKERIPHEFILIFNEPNTIELSYIKKIERNRNIPIKILICPRETLYSSWNRGIKKSKYKNITFWNVDDVRFANAIIDGLQKIKEGNEIIYFPFIYKRYINIFNFNLLIKLKIINPPEFQKKIFLQEMHIGPFFMVKKNVFEKIGYFDKSFRISGDFDWSVRATKENLNFKKSEEIAGIFTNNGATLSGQKSKLQESENRKILDTI